MYSRLPGLQHIPPSLARSGTSAISVTANQIYTGSPLSAIDERLDTDTRQMAGQGDEMNDGNDNRLGDGGAGEPPYTPEMVLRGAPTPIPISPRTRNLLMLAAVIGLILLIRAAPVILTISLGGAFLALILSFPVRLLSRVMPRGAAIVLTLLTLALALAVAIFVAIPVLVNQISELIEAIPDLADEGDELLRDILRPLQERDMVSDDSDAVIDDLRTGAIERASQVAEGFLDNLLGAVTSIFDILVKTFGIVFVAVYLLIDARRMKAAFIRSAPAKYRRDAQVLWEDFGSSLSRYLGGLSISLLLQGVLSGLALWVLGVPYPVLLGLWVSMTAIIPYLGAYLGAIPAVLLGFYQSTTIGILTIVVYIAIQQLESNVLTPRIQGQAVRVHPILVLLTVIALSEIDGLRGAVFAVPLLAVIRVLFDFLSVRLRVQP
ncbi:MAG TPA: AI-2E family transporter [Thermomicrobiales bacterium]|nr:AI-2E family transporter [Thermomicrobiales bacterium]